MLSCIAVVAKTPGGHLRVAKEQRSVFSAVMQVHFGTAGALAAEYTAVDANTPGGHLRVAKECSSVLD